jgi:hypothetical protein
MLLFFLRASLKRKLGIIFLIVFLLGTSLAYNIQSARAGALTVASNKVTNSTPGTAAVSYVTTFTFPGATPIRCMVLDFTTTTATPGAHPAGFTTTGATKGSVTGGGLTDGDWTLYNTVNGVVQYEAATTKATTATSVAITTNNVTNPTSAGVYYAQVRTFRGIDASHHCTNEQDIVLIAFAITTGQSLSVNVDPSLTFSITNLGSGVAIGNGATTTVDISAATANTIPMGNVNPSTNSIVGQSLSVQTNAVSGYTVYASYSGTLNDGLAHTIADHTGTNGAPSTFPSAGTSAFGYQSGSSTLSGSGTRFTGNKWAKFETWGYEVARKTTKTSGADITNVGIQVGVDGSQEAGTYTTTIIYVATPTY